MELFDFEGVVARLANQLSASPEVFSKAEEIKSVYRGQRGLMVVDVVSSRRRNYEHRVKAMLNVYRESTEDLSLAYLATHEPPNLGLMHGEAETMQEVAKALLQYGAELKLASEDEIAETWANNSADPEVASIVDSVRGIGPALLQYLRLLSGVDTIKPDVWVRAELEKVGVPVRLFSDEGIVEVATQLSEALEIPLSVLDQLLWRYPDPSESLKNGYLT
jgi:hypothetical protein